MLREGGKVEYGTNLSREAQGGRRYGSITYSAADLDRSPGQVTVPAESRSDVSAHGFWNQGTAMVFDIKIDNLNAESYLHMAPKNSIAKVGKEKKDL